MSEYVIERLAASSRRWSTVLQLHCKVTRAPRDAWRVFDLRFLPAARDLKVGDEVLVLTWLYRADRDVLIVHPRDDQTRPLTGVFSTRSADRPNPIGLHRFTILTVDGPRVQVQHLEALAIVDVKPVLNGLGER
jgi:tRNA (Thr-GGU) A37 N-methylase